jgi:phosphoglycolate phosphatase
LADTSKDVWQSLQVAAKECGGTISQDYMENPVNLSLPMKEIFSHIFSNEDTGMFKQFETIVNHHYRNENAFCLSAPYPELHTVVSYLNEQGYRQFIATMKSKESLLKLLNLWEWTGFFEETITQDVYAEKTLSKEKMTGILLEKSQIDKQTCCMIGDSAGDIQAAKCHGLFSIGVTYGDGNSGLLKKSEPDILIQQPQELKQFFLRGGMLGCMEILK